MNHGKSLPKNPPSIKNRDLLGRWPFSFWVINFCRFPRDEPIKERQQFHCFFASQKKQGDSGDGGPAGKSARSGCKTSLGHFCFIALFAIRGTGPT